MYKFKAKNAAMGVPMFLESGTPVKYIQEMKQRTSDGKSIYLCLAQFPDRDMPFSTYEGDDKHIYMAGEDIIYPCITSHDLLSFDEYIKKYIKCWLSAYKDIMVHYDSDQYENLQQMKEHISELVKMLDDEEIDLSIRIERIFQWLTKNHKSLWW